MNLIKPARSTLALLFIFLALPEASSAQTAREQMLATVTRLEKRITQLRLPDEERQTRAGEISMVKESLQQGRLHLGLTRLQFLWVEVMTSDYVASKAEIKSVEAFEKEWQRLGAELEAKEKRLTIAFRANSSALAVALAEASLSQVRPYYQSGRLYGLNTTVASGLYYMGLAPANLEFAIFCRELRFPENRAKMSFRSLQGELGELEALMLESYRSTASTDNQAKYNRLNSTLKMAVELNGEGRFAGALYKYMEACLLFYLLGAPPVDEKELARLGEQARSIENRLKRETMDHTIGQAYLEIAQEALGRGERGGPLKDEARRAAVILDRVMPRYFRITSGDK